jgi:hypothetical protein
MMAISCRTIFAGFCGMMLAGPAMAEDLDQSDAMNEAAEKDRRIVLDLGNDFAGRPAEGDQAGSIRCAPCLSNRRTNENLRLTANERRQFGKWRSNDSLGYSVSMGGLEVGLWGDVREVNNAANSEEGIVPSLAESTGAGGSLDIPGIGGPGAGSLQAGGASIGAPSGSLANVGSVNRIPLNSVRVDNVNRSGAELAYREYIAGLFVSSDF